MGKAEGFGKIDAKDVELFREGSVHESVDYFGTIEYFSENFDGELSLHAHDLVMSMRFIFGDD